MNQDDDENEENDEFSSSIRRRSDGTIPCAFGKKEIHTTPTKIFKKDGKSRRQRQCVICKKDTVTCCSRCETTLGCDSKFICNPASGRDCILRHIHKDHEDFVEEMG